MEMQFLKSGDIVTVGNSNAAYVVVEYPARLTHSPWTIDSDTDTVSISVRGIVEDVPISDVHKLDTQGLTLGDKVKVTPCQSFDYDRECVISSVVIDPNDTTKSWAKVDFLGKWPLMDNFNEGSRDTFNWSSLTS